MTDTGTWIVFFATILVGLVGLLMAARGDGLFVFAGWLLVLFGVLFGSALIRRLCDQSLGKK